MDHFEGPIIFSDSDRERKVKFLFPLVTDVQTTYRVPEHEKHRFFYSKNSILFFKQEYEIEIQPSCTDSLGEALSVFIRRCRGEEPRSVCPQRRPVIFKD